MLIYHWIKEIDTYYIFLQIQPFRLLLKSMLTNQIVHFYHRKHIYWPNKYFAGHCIGLLLQYDEVHSFKRFSRVIYSINITKDSGLRYNKYSRPCKA